MSEIQLNVLTMLLFNDAVSIIIIFVAALVIDKISSKQEEESKK